MSKPKKTKRTVCCHQNNILGAVLLCACMIFALVVILFPFMPDSEEPPEEENKVPDERKIGSMTREQYAKALERELRLREKEKQKEEKRKRRCCM